MDRYGSLEKVLHYVQFVGLVGGSILQFLCIISFLSKGFHEMPGVSRDMFQLDKIQSAIGIGYIAFVGFDHLADDDYSFGTFSWVVHT